MDEQSVTQCHTIFIPQKGQLNNVYFWL